MEGHGREPGSMIGSDALIPAELIAELAQSAKVRPLIHPNDAATELKYVPSQALTELPRALPRPDVPVPGLRSSRECAAISTTPCPTGTAGRRTPRTSNAFAACII